MATIVDVAKRAGVAVTTVSRVLNDKGQVSAAATAKTTILVRTYAVRGERSVVTREV